MSFFLRPARSTDAGKIGAILTEANTAQPWKPRLHTGAEDIAHAATMIDRGWVTVAEHLEKPLLFGFVARDGDFIHALFISPQARGNGVGRALMRQAKSHADTLDLWTFQANTGALRFYQREGFVELTRTDGAQNEERLPDVHLRWQRSARNTATQPAKTPPNKPAEAAKAAPAPAPPSPSPSDQKAKP